jgi:protein-tyrosine-phosphatase
MAQAICNAEIAARLKVPHEALGARGVQALSAGLSAKPGSPMTVGAQDVLREIGIPALEHRARNLDAQMADRAEAIFCMTEEQRQLVIKMFPKVGAKVHRLKQDGDIQDPAGKGPADFLDMAKILRHSINERLEDLGIVQVQPG